MKEVIFGGDRKQRKRQENSGSPARQARRSRGPIFKGSASGKLRSTRKKNASLKAGTKESKRHPWSNR